MGLAERRAAKDFQDTQFPPFQADIQKLAGHAVPIEVAWEELAKEDQSHLYKEAWPDLYFRPIIEALRQITRDDMGKEAVKGGLKRIQIRNSKGAYSPAAAISFEGGTLLVDHDLSNVGDVADRTKYIIEIIEKAL